MFAFQCVNSEPQMLVEKLLELTGDVRNHHHSHHHHCQLPPHCHHLHHCHHCQVSLKCWLRGFWS